MNFRHWVIHRLSRRVQSAQINIGIIVNAVSKVIGGRGRLLLRAIADQSDGWCPQPEPDWWQKARLISASSVVEETRTLNRTLRQYERGRQRGDL